MSINVDVGRRRMHGREFPSPDQFSKGNYQAADSMYKTAVSKAESSKNRLQLPLILQEQSDVYVKENKLPDAEACLVRAFDIYVLLKTTRVAAPERTVVLEGQVKALEKLADVFVLQNKLTEAEKKFKEALELNRSFGGAVENSVRISTKYASLLKILKKDDLADDVQNQVDATTLSEPDVAQLLMRGVQDFSKTTNHGKDISKFKSLVAGAMRFNRPDLARLANDYLGLCYLSVNRLNEADNAFAKGVRCARMTPTFFNKQLEHEAFSSALAESACTKLLQGKPLEADKLLAEAKRNDWQVACVYINLVMSTLCDTQQFASAEIICNRLIEFAKPAQGTRAPTEAALAGMMQLGDSLQQQRKFAQADGWYFRRLALLEKNKAPKGQLAEMWQRIGIELAGREKYVDSNNYLQRSLPEVIKARGYEILETANVVCRIADNYAALKKWNDSVKPFQEACGIYQKIAPGSMELLHAMRGLAEAEDNLGHFSEALPLHKHCLAILERLKGPNSLQAAVYTNLIAHDHMMLRHFPMAEKLFKNSLEILSTKGGQPSEPLASTLEQLANCYITESKNAEAEPLLRRAAEMRKLLNNKPSPQ